MDLLTIFLILVFWFIGFACLPVNNNILLIIWGFFGAPICGFVIIYLMHFLGFNSSPGSGDKCEVEYSQRGITSVICIE